MATKSEAAMQALLERVEALEQTVEELRQMVGRLHKKRRAAVLMEVDQVEREFDLRPRTSELRDRFG